MSGSMALMAAWMPEWCPTPGSSNRNFHPHSSPERDSDSVSSRRGRYPCAPGIYGHTFSNATFTVQATSSTAVTYQWRRNGANIPGATTSTLVIPNVTLDNVGSYDCVIRDAVGQITTQPAQLIVNIPVVFTQHP